MILQPETLTQTSMLAAASRATNNAASTGLDLSVYDGRLAIVVDIGAPTVGDAASTFQIKMQDSATNNASNAADISGKSYVSPGNNAATVSTIAIDPRAQNRYLFARVIITGGNSPAFPVSVQAVGSLRIS